MKHNLSSEPCLVTWCEVTGAHDRHWRVYEQVHGVSVTADTEHDVTLQAGVVQWRDSDPQPAVALVVQGQPPQQYDVAPRWEDAVRVALAILGAANRHHPVEP